MSTRKRLKTIILYRFFRRFLFHYFNHLFCLYFLPLKMSGDDLRSCCIHNQVDQLREYLSLRANPCSTDEHGLSALHYAVWNGHVECVRLLVMNPHGVTREREKTSCVNLKSTTGYTALHLLALEGPLQTLKDVLFAILLTGGDMTIVDQEGQTPLQIAKENKNQVFLDAIQEFIQLQRTAKDKLKKLYSDLKANYLLVKKKRFTKENGIEGEEQVDEEEDEQEESGKLILSPGKVPSSPKQKGSAQNPVLDLPNPLQQAIQYIEKPITIDKPKDLSIHEESIPTLTKFSFVSLQGVDSLKGLTFVRDEALKNVQRREKLVQNFETTLPKIDVKHMAYGNK
jgi:hypothetical protein